MTAEGTSRRTHSPTVFEDNGQLIVEWDTDPNPGEWVLMSVELFESMIKRFNETR
jgi:hypothetical protein